MLAYRLTIFAAFLLAVPSIAQNEDEVIDLQELLQKVSKGFDDFSREMRREFGTFANTLRTLNDGMNSMKITLEDVRKSSTEFTTSNQDIKQEVEKSSNTINTIGQNIKLQMEQSSNNINRFAQEVKEQLKQSEDSLVKFKKMVEEQNRKSESYFRNIEQLFRDFSKSTGSSCEAFPEKFEAILTRLNDVRELSIAIRESNRAVRDELQKSTSTINTVVQSQKEIRETVSEVKEVTNKIHDINTSVQKESSTCSKSIEDFLKEQNIWRESLNQRIDKVVEKYGTCDKDDGKDNGDNGGKEDKSPVLDCADAYKKYGYRTTQVYNIKPVGVNEAFPVFCDMSDGGGWTVIQRRGDYGNPEDYFFRTWADYKYGFGDMNKEFWLGNEKISVLTSQQEYQAKIDLWDLDSNQASAWYNNFRVEGELGKYMLRVNGFSGTAGDALKYHNNFPFSTRDKNNIRTNMGCPENEWRSGWWYGGCSADLNGLNLRNHQTQQTKGRGIKWGPWLGEGESLGATAIKIRPKDF